MIKTCIRLSFTCQTLFNPKQTLGKITNYIWDGQTPAITIQYATRREAEKAMSEGRTLGDRLLTLTWAFDTSLSVSSQSATASVAGSQHVSPHSFTSVTPHSTTPLLSPDDTLVSGAQYGMGYPLYSITKLH